MKRLNSMNKYAKLHNALIQSSQYSDGDTKYILASAAKILSFKMQRLAVDAFNYAFIEDIGSLIYDYQTQKYEDRTFIKPEELHYDVLKKLIPDCLYNGVAYRALCFDKDKFTSKNTLEQDLRNFIQTGRIESWSLSKQFVENAETQLFMGYYDKDKHFIVRLKANITNGVNVEKFWQGAQQYLEDSLEDLFLDIATSFKNEQEILAITPDTYTIYNIPQIKQEVFS